MDSAHFPCLNILGFSGHSAHPNIILGWTQSTHPPCLNILGFPRHSTTSRSSRDGCCSPPYRGIDTSTTYVAHLPLSEYPGIPWILRSAQDHRGWIQLTPPCLSILGFPGYSDQPRIILGWTQSTLPPFWVSWDSRDTPTSPGPSQDGQSSPPYVGVSWDS